MQGRKWLVPCVCLLAMLATTAMTASANAARSVYPSDRDAVSLRNGPAGWSGATSSEGLCVPVLLCPAITNSIPSNGGPGNSGYLHTELGSLTGVGATSIGTFTGPAFKYRGVGGTEPANLVMRLSRRADVAALLDVTGNDAEYSVRLRNLSGGPDVQVLNGSGLDGAPQWSQVPAVEIDPSQLQIGNRYRAQIVSRFESGVQVVTGSYVDYAKVRLTAKSGKTGPGGNGDNGHDGNNGADGADAVGGVISNTVRVKGKYLIVKVKCLRNAPQRKCKSRLNARLSKHGPKVTATQKARVKAGRKAKVRLRIQGRYRTAVAGRKRITVQRKTRVAGKVRTTYKRAKVRG